ncbi:MAG: hypothetical protein MJ247_01185 [Alphaproteobacteria bacterium]|nr:hypothetical protein [Alphaproteobacteria bacterium]
MAENKLKATSILYKAGYSPEKAAEVADAILNPKDGEIVIGYGFFYDSPKEAGKAIAEILPMSTAKSLVIDQHNKMWGFTKTPLAVMRTNAGRNWGEHNAVGDVLEALAKTEIEKISLNEVALGDNCYRKFQKGIEESKTLKSVSITHSDVEPSIENGTFLPNLANTKIEEFKLGDCNINSDKSKGFFEGIASATNLKTLDLSGNQSLFRDNGGEFIAKLPSCVTNLNVSNCPVRDWHCATQIAANLRQNKNLTDLGLSSCYMGETEARDIIKVLPDTNLWRIDLSGNVLDDKAAKDLTTSLNNEECHVYETKLMDKPKNPVTDILRRECENIAEESTLNELKEAEAKNYKKYEVVRDQEIAREVYANQSDEERAKDVYTAAKAGKIGEFLKLKPLKPQDYLVADEKGKTLIEHIWESKSLDQVFTPNNWSNPKDMQNLWNNVPDKQKEQMDGKEGRPSFIKNKSIVTANALRKSMSHGR